MKENEKSANDNTTDTNEQNSENGAAAEKQHSGDSANEDDIVYPKGLKLVAIIVALCLAVLLVALDQTIIATAIPRITDRFNSVQDIGWYGSVSREQLRKSNSCVAYMKRTG